MKHSTLRVAIMGASSGIGAATAIAFARRTLGEIDLYFSNVGAGVVGKYADVPLADHHRVIETNLVTHMNDAHAVLPVFLQQGHGIWVNMISAGGLVASPYAAAYSASKFGLRGFSEALRAELGKNKHIHVCDVYPTFVDTPGFSHAANYTGAKLSYPPGVMRPEKVADAVVALARKPRPTTVIGAPESMLTFGQFAAPDLIASGMNRFLGAWSKRADRARVTKGALYNSPGGASGLYGPERVEHAPYSRPQSQRSSTLVAGAALVAAAVGLGLLRKRS
jgi:short-subunit dehydrogenase